MNPRWLLPFTHGVDMRAIDYLVSLAENNGATLIPVSLVCVPTESRSGGARLEHIQQSKDYLEAVKYKAARLQVPVERYEVFTSDVTQSITMLVHDLHCDGIVMVAIEQKEILLHKHELKQLLVEPPVHNRTERLEERRLREREKRRHIVQGFFYVVANAFIHVLPVLFVQTNRKESLA